MLAGEYTDAETGFVYLRARYYDPATGQFLSRDPAVALTRSPYGYVNGNPLNDTDPKGLYGYRFSWDIGNAGPDGPERIMNLLRNDLDYVFPFAVNAGSAPNDELILGHKYGLNLMGYNSGAQVTGLTDTSFTLKSLYGHLEGAGKNIEFSFCTMDNGDTRFTVHAWGRDGFREWIPFEKRANRLVAHILWGSMAANLKDNIAAGDLG